VAEDYFWADELFVSTADSKAAQGQLTGRHHLAFQAKDRAAVDVFTESGSRMAVRTTAHPASAPITPGYYAAFLLDPDGNNIEAVYHGESDRSAASVKITF